MTRRVEPALLGRLIHLHRRDPVRSRSLAVRQICSAQPLIFSFTMARKSSRETSTLSSILSISGFPWAKIPRAPLSWTTAVARRNVILTKYRSVRIGTGAPWLPCPAVYIGAALLRCSLNVLAYRFTSMCK